MDTADGTYYSEENVDLYDNPLSSNGEATSNLGYMNWSEYSYYIDYKL